LGTASKILSPGLRIAWLVASDAELFERLVAAKQAVDLHTSSFAQRVACRYFTTPGALDLHVGRLRAAYVLRRTAMVQALERHLPAGCEWTRPDGGLFIWVRLPTGFDGYELLKSAAREKLAFVPGEPFWVGPPERNTLRLNFSNATAERIEEGVRRLGAVMSG
jgi:2-aminoadipate transaminase